MLYTASGVFDCVVSNQASKLTSAILICDVNVLRYLSVEISFVSQVKVGSENKQTSSGSQKLSTN